MILRLFCWYKYANTRTSNNILIGMNLDGPSNKIKIDDNIHEKAIIGMYNIGAMCETIE